MPSTPNDWVIPFGAARPSDFDTGSNIDALSTDLVETSWERLLGARVGSSAEVCALPEPLVGFSAETAAEARALARFLRENLYEHPTVLRMAARGEEILRELWGAYTADPPPALRRADGETQERAIADYLAGMTDRFAMDEHRRLFEAHAQG